jgi:hypothetical protein
VADGRRGSEPEKVRAAAHHGPQRLPGIWPMSGDDASRTSERYWIAELTAAYARLALRQDFQRPRRDRRHNVLDCACTTWSASGLLHQSEIVRPPLAPPLPVRARQDCSEICRTRLWERFTLPELFGAAAIPSGYTVTYAVRARPLACVLVTHFCPSPCGRGAATSKTEDG